MKNILLLLFVFVIAGCIDDNGNYDYKATRELDVKGVARTNILTQGESVTFAPKAIVKYDLTETEIEGVKFEWSVDHEVVSTEKIFTYTAKENGTHQAMLRMIDPLTEAISCYVFKIEVQSAFIEGLLILSEENGQTQLSIIRSKLLSDPDTLIYDKEWKDIYVSANGGEQIKGKPLSMTEHWSYDGNSSIGEITLLTKENDKVRVQELNGENIKRETYIEQEFVDEKVPEFFNPKKVIHTPYDSFILDESGEMYTRRSENSGGYHTGYFSDDIKLWNGKKFSDILFTQFYKIKALLALEENEKGEQNYVGIYSGYYNCDNNLYRLEIVGDDVLDFKDIKGDIVWDDWRNNGNWGESGMSVMTKTEEGDYILHCFDLSEATLTSIEVISSYKVNLTKEKGISNLVGMCTNKLLNYTYYCDGKTIYAIDNEFNEDFYTMKTFDKEIVAIEDCSISSVYGNYPTAMAIAFEDGTIEIWEIERKNAGKFKNRIYVSKNNYGKIKNLLSKIGDGGNLFFNLN